ncbi:MAG: ribosomal protein S18-alanine N-acetyltransferase [Christensenellales bacterium]
MEIEIVAMQRKHVERVFEIENALIASPWSRANIEKLADDERAVAKVAIVDGEVVGYYSFYTVIDEADVNNIAVDAKWQQQGIGSALMKDLLQECLQRDINAVTLEVGAGNTAAKNLYAKFGFVSEGVRKNYYNNTEDAIIMWRK